MKKRILKSIGITTIVAATAVPSALAMRSGADYAGATGPAISIPANPVSLSPDASPQDATHALIQLGVTTSSSVSSVPVPGGTPDESVVAQNLTLARPAVDQSDVFTRYAKSHQPVP